MDTSDSSSHSGASQATGVGVLDKSVLLLSALEPGPMSLADLAADTQIPRPTAHRLLVALESHRLVSRNEVGRFQIGGRVAELAATDQLRTFGQPALDRLRDATVESAQLFRRMGQQRICIAVADRTSGLRDTVPLGAALPMTAGSAAQVLAAFGPTSQQLPDAVFDQATLNRVRELGWAQSVAEREPGVASLSVPVMGPAAEVVAALSLSGPRERLGTEQALTHLSQLQQAARAISTGAFGGSV
ncbi:MAG: IclR family transcriptional regulator [Actinomycetia bacterium]|nr:IclR family transcriptional regulator [Actinomycetes bacterium]